MEIKEMKCKRLHYCAKCVGAQFRGGELSAWYLENKSESVTCTLSLMKYCILMNFFFVIGGMKDRENPAFGGYFRTSIAFFRPLSTADGLF